MHSQHEALGWLDRDGVLMEGFGTKLAGVFAGGFVLLSLFCQRPAPQNLDFEGLTIRRIKNRLEICSYNKYWNVKRDDEGTKLWRRTTTGYVEIRFHNDLVLTKP